MAHAEFVHLRVHTAYSLLEGALRVGELVKLCQDHAMPALAMTDSGNLFGGMEFAGSCMKAGIQPIMGTALAIGREGTGGGAFTGSGQSGRKPEPDRLVLLAANDAGYDNISKLSSRAFLETPAGETPQVSMADLETHAEGVIALTGGAEGPVGRLLQESQKDGAVDLAKRLSAIFPGSLYIELQRHGQPEEIRTEAGFLDIAYDLDLPIVATNECFFPDESAYEAHDALICVSDGAYVSQQDRRHLTPEHRFKSAEEMKVLFADLPEAFHNTLVIAQRCAARPPLRDPILPGYESAEGRDEATEMAAQAQDGLDRCLEAHVFTADMDTAQREEVAKPYQERLKFELDVIIQMGFPGYFLIVSDFIKWAKDHDIPVGPGRGSGAGSVVAWALSITDLDPLRFGLLFERFLNPERVSMPDFDIDFCQDRRDEVISYVQDKYGHDKVAQIITFGKLQARAVLRDVGRVLEMPYGQVDRICKMVPNNPANPMTLGEAIQAESGLRNERDSDPTVARLLTVGQKLEGLYRHASTHAAGVVIGDRPLDQLVPLYRDPKSDMPVTQFNMKYVESAGLVKFDFLGLKTLTVIDKAVKLIRQRGVELEIDKLPLDDTKTYEMLSRGETVGVFQLESSGMRDVLRGLQPDVFEDIIALVALYRPGPMDNIPRFIATKKGKELPDYMHETLKPLLEETYGVIIYQEQVMQIAQVLSGYSLGDADLLRRAMGKKIKAEMDAQRAIFVNGAVEKGVAKKQANTIFDLVDKFAGYGFNKSHAACYALVAYQTAWLKANYPVEFLAASMTLDLTNTDKLGVFKEEVERLGIELRNPDINKSEAFFTVEDVSGKNEGAIRYALAAVKNVGRAAMDSVVEERNTSGLFKTVFDFSGRLESRTINKRQIENLARAGAFDSLEKNRHKVHQSAEILLRHASAAAEDRASGQESLFGGPDAGIDEPELPSVTDWSSMERLRNEFDAIGFYLSAHPLDMYERDLKRMGAKTWGEVLPTLTDTDKNVRLGGTVMGKQERMSKRGNRFAFVQFSDSSGTFEGMFFADALTNARPLLENGTNVVVDIEARLDEGAPRIGVTRIQRIDKLVADTAAGLEIRLNNADPLAHISDALEQANSGKGRVKLWLSIENGTSEVEINLPGRYAITAEVRDSIAAAEGILELRDV
ncbi:MAG: DNA polymerase III subunit alpha [Alphaproteobacteria bacterium]|jgi:DNA polymerase III subunit alpha|nr:DNA polymerase III subunit alpha [Alphaproteobacteria bacterium]MBT4085773.1 DNA polymerase III subunit alpha [Alphaproteobacteria bacterium]MBT4543352.1 DNA polymerase III subunit alpha [Alphaproteobacteria bacterium]MBT7747118.1 DNA polymerase III subunit alpha [Alphaproteobacteria bacterium]